MEISMKTVNFGKTSFPVLVFNEDGREFVLRPYVKEILNAEENCIVQTFYGVICDYGEVTSPYDSKKITTDDDLMVELEYFPLNHSVWYQTVRLMIVAAAPSGAIYSKWGMLTADPSADDGREIALGIVEKFVKEVTKFFRNKVCRAVRV